MKIQKAVRELEKMKRKVASLEAGIEKASSKKLKSDRKRVAAFVKKLGYKTVDHLFAATSGKIAMVKAAPAKSRKRAKITTAIRKNIVADFKRGKMTAAAVARKHGISLPSVNNIKHDAGLTHSRKIEKKAAKRAVKKAPAKRKSTRKKAGEQRAPRMGRKSTRRIGKTKKSTPVPDAPLEAGSTSVTPSPI